MGKTPPKDPDEGRDPAEIARTRDDAFCTECLTWYDASDQKQVDRHAH